jgi:uncharacterized protein (TIGR04255 family)
MSVQFDPITALTPVHLGSWWTDDRRERYPVVEVRAALEATQEEFGGATMPGFSLKLSGHSPSAMWFFSAARDQLLQIQRDRFSRNWMRPQGLDAAYPSYETLLPAFVDDYSGFAACIEELGLDRPLLNQCEITYINPVPVDDHGRLSSLLAPWSGEMTEGFLAQPEDGQLAMRWVIRGSAGEPIGRLYVLVQPVVSPEGPAYLLTLSAKGRPLGAGPDGAKAFLDIGHEWIVRGFTTLTTQPMHELWERYQ